MDNQLASVKAPPSTEVAKSTGNQSGGIVQLRSLTDLKEFSEFLSKSSLIPKGYVGKPADIAVGILYGHELGFSPLGALQSIAVINGNPGMYGDAPLALVRSRGLLEWIKEEWDDSTKTATCKIKRVGDPSTYEGSFSIKDAERIGLANRDTYKNYGKRMCQFRARSFPLRDAFGDVLKGMRQAEELEEFIETTAEHVVSEPINMPRRASETAAAPIEKADPLDQRTTESEKVAEEPQESPKSEDVAGADLAAVKIHVQKWIDEASDQDILMSSGADHLFEMMKTIPDEDQDRSKLSNAYMKRKTALWKKAKEANSQK